METYVGLFVIYALVFGGYCGALAKEKGHSIAMWWLGGVLFSIIALIAAAGLPDRKTRMLIGEIAERVEKP